MRPEVVHAGDGIGDRPAPTFLLLRITAKTASPPWFDVDYDVADLGHLGNEPIFDLVADEVALGHRYITGYLEMQIDEIMQTDLAALDLVHAKNLRETHRQHLDSLDYLCRGHAVEELARRIENRKCRSRDHRDADYNRREIICRRPSWAAHPDRSRADYDGCRGCNVRLVVQGIRGQGAARQATCHSILETVQENLQQH